MAKKNRKQEILNEPVENNEPVVFDNDQTLYEAEAYGSPQPEAGSDVTVMKTVGIGGPVPIVAPKHNTIQLQPIVVPLAVVPYMTQDSNVLRTDGRPQGAVEEYSEATSFSSAMDTSVKKAKKRGASPRLFVLVSLILSAVLVLPFILSYFKQTLGLLNFDGLDRFNIINTIIVWIKTKSVDTAELYRDIIFIAAGAAMAIMFVVELIALLAGKYPRAFSIIFALIASGTSLAILIIDMVHGVFVANERVALIVFLAISLLALVLAIIFTIILNRADDRADRERRSASEI